MNTGDLLVTEPLRALSDTPEDGTQSKPRYVGQSMLRHEHPAILTGHGRFADGLGVKPSTLHAAVWRAPHAHAEVVSVDGSAALRLAGVHTILTVRTCAPGPCDLSHWR